MEHGAVSWSHAFIRTVSHTCCLRRWFIAASHCSVWLPVSLVDLAKGSTQNAGAGVGSQSVRGQSTLFSCKLQASLYLLQTRCEVEVFGSCGDSGFLSTLTAVEPRWL